MKIKCYSGVECESCHSKGMLQVFLDREAKPKYARIRHSQKIDNKTVYLPSAISSLNKSKY